MAMARDLDVRDAGVSSELSYLTRHAWVSFKKSVGLSRRNDRTYYVERLIREQSSQQGGGQGDVKGNHDSWFFRQGMSRVRACRAMR